MLCVVACCVVVMISVLMSDWKVDGQEDLKVDGQEDLKVDGCYTC